MRGIASYRQSREGIRKGPNEKVNMVARHFAPRAASKKVGRPLVDTLHATSARKEACYV